MKSYKKYLQEHGIIDFKNSDTLKDTDDIMYSNTPPLTYYSGGKGFEITDNQEFYEIIKILHDKIDKHFYGNNFKYSIDIKNRILTLTFESEVKENNSFIERFIDNLMTRIAIFFKGKYKMDLTNTEINNNKIYKLTIEKIGDIK